MSVWDALWNDAPTSRDDEWEWEPEPTDEPDDDEPEPDDDATLSLDEWLAANE